MRSVSESACERPAVPRQAAARVNNIVRLFSMRVSPWLCWWKVMHEGDALKRAAAEQTAVKQRVRQEGASDRTARLLPAPRRVRRPPRSGAGPACGRPDG